MSTTRTDSAAHPLEARLFGAPHLSWRGEPLHLSSQKGRALLYALALRPEGVSRDELAELFWGAGKLANVRQALYQLRQLPGAAHWLHLGGPGERVRVDVKGDVGAFREALQAQRYAEALALSNATLLAGGRVADAPAWDDYLEQCRLSVAEGRRDALRGEEVPPEILEAHLVEKSRAHALRTPRATLPLQLLRPPHLVGRDEVWARLVAAREGGQVVFLAGAAGVGKTRLLRDFTASLGSSVFNEARPGDVHSPYIVTARGVRRFLRAFPEVQLGSWEQLALARLLPQYTLEDTEEDAAAPELIPSPLDTPGKHLRFTEAVTSLLARIRRSVAALPLDDVHYIDHASHVLMAQTFQQCSAGERAASLLVAYRPEETSPSFERLLAPLLESGVGVRIQLEPLTVEGVGELVESLELPGGADLARRLHRYVGGNPMLTLETLKSMLSSGDLNAAPTLDLGATRSANRPEPLAERGAGHRVNALLRRRLETLSNVALRVVRAFALTQDELPTAHGVHALAELVEMSPLAVAEGLEELGRAQILSGERFVHDLIYETVLADIPDTRAQVLHERAALVLAQLPKSKPERVARHWLSAGSGENAAPYLLRAALTARQMRADKEAKVHYFQALWCLNAEDSASSEALRERALKGLGALADLTRDADLRAAALGALEPETARHPPKRRTGGLEDTDAAQGLEADNPVV